jgi:intein-encoded DNA endonuclease-like protein
MAFRFVLAYAFVRPESEQNSSHQGRATLAKGVDIEMAPLDQDHVRAKITWSEQDFGGGKLVVEVTVKKSMKTLPKTDDQLRSDARALAVRFARAFADTIEN